jgi:hypothetical protein
MAVALMATFVVLALSLIPVLGMATPQPPAAETKPPAGPNGADVWFQ